MRLLPVGPGDERRRAAPRQAEAERPRHRSGDERQYLPLRHVCPHPRRHSPGGRGAGLIVSPQDIRLSRRAVLQGAGTLVIALTLPMGLGRAQAPAAPPPVDPNAFVRVGADDVVTVIVKHIEFGQGPNTGLATLVAEEMDADWAKVRAESAPADMRLYVKLKDPADFTLIGRDRAGIKLDSVAKSNGTAKFTLDIAEPEMLTVVVAHPEGFGAKLASFDAAEALKVKGVVAVKQIPTGVAVYGRGTWPAIKGRKALKLTWDDSGAETRDSEAMLAEYKAQVATKGTVAAEHGDADAALAAGEVIEADYLFPFLAHAPMEPLNGYLVWNAEGAQGRMGSQMQTGDQAGIAEVLGLKPEQVTIETMLAGGSFGRRATPTGESARELAEAAKAIG